MMSSGLADTVCRDIDAAREELIELCGQLVAASSVNPPGRTVEVSDVLRAYLSGHGIPTERVAADDDAPNIIGCVEAGAGGRHVVFNAHMDTMEAGDEAAWTVPIMRLSRRNGRLYGLGMGNMKGALAAMCLATTILNRHSNAWRGRLTMTAVSDEVMFGERGAVFLLQQRPDMTGDFLISGEGPGFMHFAVAEKGLLWLDLETRSGGGDVPALPAGMADEEGGGEAGESHDHQQPSGSIAIAEGKQAAEGDEDRCDERDVRDFAARAYGGERWRGKSRAAALAECRDAGGWHGSQPSSAAGAGAARRPASTRHHRASM